MGSLCRLLVVPATLALSANLMAAPEAYISELFLADLNGSPAPDAVELSGLHTLTAATADLVVLDASSFLGPIVLQVVTVPTDQAVLLISDEPWPDALWTVSQVSNGTTLTQLGAADSDWDFPSSRTLVLFDRATKLTPGSGPLAHQANRLDGAQILDTITFQRGPIAASLAGEPVYSTDAGYVLSRPLTAVDLLVGTVNEKGVLQGIDGVYEVTPGLINQAATNLPEPTGLAAVVLGVALFCAGRRPMMWIDAR